MKKIFFSLLLSLLFVAVQAQTKALTDSVTVGDVAPELALPDSMGQVHRLSSLRGQWVLVNFWASWCPDCRRELPTVQQLTQNYPQLRVYAVSLDRERKAWTRAIHRYQMKWINVSEVKGWNRKASLYGIQWIPTSFLINPEGRVVSIASNETELLQIIQQHLGKQ